MRRTSVPFLISLFLGVTALQAGAVDAVLTRAVQPTNVFWSWIYLSGGVSHTVETRNLSKGSDTMLYLIRSSDMIQVAYNDDRYDTWAYGNRASRVSVYVPVTGFYNVLVRSYSNSTGGTCDLYVDGAMRTSGIRFGGFMVTTGWNYGDRFQTAHYDSSWADPTDTVMYAFANRSLFVARDDDSGCNRASRLVMTGSGDSPAGAHIVIAKYGQTPPTPRDWVRFIINPMSTGDADGDNVADRLETWLGTDPNNGDTDGDGLWDDWEIFGCTTPYGDEDLPAYGASPTKQDLFIEQDYMTYKGGGDMRPQAAANQRVITAFNNHGIALHIDTGNLGSRSNRGGQNFPWVAPFEGGCPLSSSYHSTKNNVYSLWADPAYFAPSRRHLFIYQVFGSSNSSGGGGSTGCAGNNFSVPGDLTGTSPGRANVVQMWCSIWGNSGQEGGTLMHESGHNLDLWHGGGDDTNYKPNFLSTMNYLFQFGGLDATGNPNYSESRLCDLVEPFLRESDGVCTSLNTTAYTTIRNKIGAADVRSPTFPNAMDWNRNGRVDNNILWPWVGADVNGDGKQTWLVGHDDWTHVHQSNGGFKWVGKNAGVMGMASWH